LFHTCKPGRNEEAPEKAKELVRDFGLNKDLDGFIASVIDQDHFDRKKFMISGIILQLFKTWDEFEATIFGLVHTESIYLEEFKRFMKTLKIHDYTQY